VPSLAPALSSKTLSQEKKMLIGFAYEMREAYITYDLSQEEIDAHCEDTTVDSLEKAICHHGHTVQRIGDIKALVQKLAAGERWDLVFNICEGNYGVAREARVSLDCTLSRVYNAAACGLRRAIFGCTGVVT
jgi:hypothetical protein